MSLGENKTKGSLVIDNVTDVIADCIDPEAEMITSSCGGIARASVKEVTCDQRGDDTLWGCTRASLRVKGGFFYKDRLY